MREIGDCVSEVGDEGRWVVRRSPGRLDVRALRVVQPRRLREFGGHELREEAGEVGHLRATICQKGFFPSRISRGLGYRVQFGDFWKRVFSFFNLNAHTRLDMDRAHMVSRSSPKNAP